MILFQVIAWCFITFFFFTEGTRSKKMVKKITGANKEREQEEKGKNAKIEKTKID
jgi:hypothetical protein